MSKDIVNTYLGKCKFSAYQIKQLEGVACCRSMFKDLIDDVFQYNEIRNCFMFCVKDCIRYDERGELKVPKSANRIMNFCVYCGTQLPDYVEEYNEELEKELYRLGITYDEIDAGQAKLPEEFLSDAWWINRNIKGLGKWCDEEFFPSMKKSESVIVTED